METFLPLSYLNDFIFCPYSIYLHQVFDNTKEEVYSAQPQQKGKSQHQIKEQIELADNKVKVLSEIYVISNTLGVYGKIDQYYPTEKKLIERKYSITTIYRGYYYQLWSQYIALQEMGFEVKSIYFQTIKNNQTIAVNLPTKRDIEELKNHIKKIARYDFNQNINVNPEKCKRCIYAALCDKTQNDHVYA